MSDKTHVPVNRTEAEVEAAPEPAAPAPRPGLGGLRDEIDRLLSAFETNSWFDRGPLAAGRAPMLSPAIDLVATEGGYAVTAELPGLSPEDVEVKVGAGQLTISGRKEEKQTEERRDYLMSERRWGGFQRAIRLPDDVDRDRVEADFSNGVLKVTLPRSEAARAGDRKIEIRAA